MPHPVARPRLLGATWIPHWALVAAQLANGASWAMALAIGLGAPGGRLDLGWAGLAWVHTVALGFLTMASLAVLIHVLHGMLDLEWVGVRAARWNLLPFAVGTAGMATGFWCHQPSWLAGGSSLVGAALAVYLTLAFLTLSRFRPGPEVSSALVRAFTLVLAMLAATALVGLGMAWALAGHGDAWWLTVAPRVHAHLGFVGWLSLLVMGVSTHTVRPLTGGKSDAVWKHVLASALVTGGLAGVVGGLLSGLGPVLWAGAIASASGAVVYVADMAGILARARVPHRVPQAYLAASGVYVLATAAVGVGTLAGHPDWEPAYLYLALVGWLGQMVNAHLHHIGIRVLATLARGEDDETPPRALLTTPLSWATFAAFQAAVLTGAVGLLAPSALAGALAGASGLVGWALMGANIARAWRRARTAPAT